MIRVRRRDFEAVIHAALAAASASDWPPGDRLSEDQMASIRAVGALGQRTLVGAYASGGEYGSVDFDRPENYCPVAQAAGTCEGFDIPGESIFTTVFDKRMRELTGQPERGAPFSVVIDG